MEHSEYPADLNSSELESRSLIWNPEQFLRGRSSSPPLSVHEDSRKIKESPTTRWPHRDQAPRPESVVIHTTSSDFMNVVHQLTGTHSSVLELNNPASNDYDAESPASTNGSPRSEDFVDGGGSGESHRHDNVFNPYKRKMLLTEKKMRISSEEGLGLQDDGYSWRKYGQKDILGAKFPRDYYRCTHRSTQNCRATKQVQRPDDDPTVFEVTYRGTHSCSQAMASNDYDAESLASADGSLRSEDLVDGGGSGESHRHDYIFNSKKRKTLPKWTEKVRISSERGLEGLRDDGYSWRKYGKKDILGAKFARSYYSCTHRITQNCWATKQVQRSDDDPTVFEVTYRGTHSCSQAMASNDYDAESLASADGSLRSEDLVDGGGSGESHRHDYIFNSKKRKTLPKWTKKARSSEEGLERLHDDGYSWRKYGQKDILGAKFPRDYYRCIYRNTQNCWATKQVQRSDDDPTVFEVTYIRTHSCSQAIASNDYDVVISYMRWDISNDDFISHLRAALSRRQISVHEDFNVVGAAPECRVLIIFLTSTYVSSYLLNTLEQQRRKYRVVYPIFYGISPSDLISNGKVYDSYFHEEERKKWQAALERLTQMPFYTLTDRSESELIDEIVRDALKVVCSSDKEDMIGMDVQVEQILSLLCIESPDVRSIGIWGTVGIGKTAIAEEIFRRISVQYETCVFVKDLHEEVEVKGHDAVREDFLSKLLEVEPDLVRMSDIKTSFLRSRLQRKRVLVILDDVNDFRDVETFLGKLTYFGPGSRVITTSRNRHVFVPCKIDHVYEVRPLDISKSLLLLDRGTFRSVLSPEFYRRLSLDLVKFSNGNPQVLQFCSRSTAAWDQLSEQVQKILPIYIPGIFERSCCGLDENERSIFLDIACFFRRMDKDDVAMLLDGCGFSAHVGFRSLVDKSLLTISHNMVDMLRFLQATGREIVRQESPDRPGDRSRLWNSEDIMDVFKCHDGTSAIEGIFLDMSKVKFDANPDGFEKMCNLRLLKIYFSEVVENHGVSLPQGLEYLPSKLRLLHWEYYPLSSLPQSFDPKNLVELNLQNSCAKKLWKGKKSLGKLRKMRLSYSYQLTKIPRLSRAPNLELLDLEGCNSLVSISQSICNLRKLFFLNLKDCSNLESAPSMVDLESLEVLNLSGCSKLENFPEISPNVKELYLGGSMIQEIPPSIKNLVLLEKLDLENSRHLVNLPISICKLKHLETLNLSGCSSLERFPDLSRKMKCLKSLDLSRTAIKELPSSISYLTALEELRFVECKNLVRLPDNAWSLRFKVEFRKIDAEKFSKLWNRFGWLKKVRRTPCSLAVPPVPVKTKRTDFHFLSYCYTCNKSLDHKQDIYLYRGEKGFCSSECRYQEMLLD